MSGQDERTISKRMAEMSKQDILDDYYMFYSGLEVAIALLKEKELTSEKRGALHSIIKDYMIDRPNRYEEHFTMYTKTIYEMIGTLLEEVNQKNPKKR